MRIRSVSSSVLFCFCWLSLLVTVASAQDNIRLTVAATSGGAPVMDLAKTDFTVRDGGKPRTLDNFSGPESKVAAPPQLGPNEFSNVPDFRETSGAIFVVLDTLDTRYIDERDEREMILKFLGRAAQAHHAVTLGILSDKGLRVFHDYHTGSDVLLAALAKAGLGGVKGAPPAGVSDAEVSSEAARLTEFSKGALSNATAQGKMLLSIVDLPFLMFQDVGFSAQGLPGRKALVWVTNTVPFDIDPKSYQFRSPKIASQGVAVNGAQVGGTKDSLPDDQVKRLTPIFRRSMRALFDGGVALYPVEARSSWSAGSDAFTQTRMITLAQITGGKAFYGSNDPYPEILQAATGNTAGYVLGYVSDASGTEFRRVDVQAGRPNTPINQPAGYFPYEGTPKSRAGDEVGLAIGSPLVYTGIRFRVAVASVEDGSAGKKKVNLVISLPADTGVLNESTGMVDLVLVANATNAKGDVVGKMNEGAGGKFPPEAVVHIKETGFQLKRSFEVSPGDATVRFLIRDNQTGRMGDVVFPLTVK